MLKNLENHEKGSIFATNIDKQNIDYPVGYYISLPRTKSKQLQLLAFLLLLPLCSLQGTYGQAVLRVRDFSQRDLEQAALSQFLQDSVGYIWLATYNGLIRYDGYEFRQFKTLPGDSIHISNSRIERIYLTSGGNIVSKNYDGQIYLFNTKRLKYTAVLDSIPTQELVNCPSSYRFPSMTNSIITNEKQLPEEIQLAIHRHPKTVGNYRFRAFNDRWGDTWMQLNDGILYRYDSISGKLVESSIQTNGREQVLHTEAHLMMQDMQGNIWYRDLDERLHYLLLEPRKYDAINHPLVMQARALLFDSKERLWVGWRHTSKIEYGGLSIYDSEHHLIGYLNTEGEVKTSHKDVPFDQSGVYSLMEDHNGNIWIGTRQSGLFIFHPTEDPMRFDCYHYEAHEGITGALQNNSIYHIIQDKGGRVWIATWGKALHYTTPGDDLDALTFHNITPSQIEGITEGQEWLSQRIRHICIDHTGHLLASTENGILYCENPNLPHKQLHFRLIGSDGTASSLQGNSVRHILETSDHRLIISTLGGLNVSTPERITQPNPFTYITESDIQGGNIYCTHESESKQIWVISETDVLLMNDSLKNGIEIFPEAEECSEAIPIRDNKDQLYLCIDNSLYCLRNMELPIQWTPNISITSFSYNDSEHGAYDLSWAALDFRNSQNIKYAYRIVKPGDNAEGGWTHIGTTHSFSNFTTAKYGDVILQICSTNSDGVWCNNTIEIPLSFKATIVEYLNALYTLLLLIAACIIIWQIRRYLKYHNLHQMAVNALLQETATAQNMRNNAEATVAISRDFSPEESISEEQPPTKTSSDNLSQDDRLFLSKIDQFIEENMLGGELNIQQIADQMGMSRTVFYRYLKSVTHVSPVEYVRVYKIKQACQLLQDPQKTITEVAYECGFGTPQSFAKAFKEVKKCTPKEFRSKNVQFEQNGQ